MDRAQIRHLAELAELWLSEEEEERMTKEIGSILAFVAELEGVDVTGVPPTAHVTASHENVLREDVPRQGLEHDDALAAAPRTAQGGFVVPTFVGS